MARSQVGGAGKGRPRTRMNDTNKPAKRASKADVKQNPSGKDAAVKRSLPGKEQRAAAEPSRRRGERAGRETSGRPERQREDVAVRQREGTVAAREGTATQRELAAGSREEAARLREETSTLREEAV